MVEILTVIMTVAGGLGTFLLGMKHLSEGLQAISGKRLKRFMALATTHRLAGVATGCVSTMIVQSSSIITVMAVGFVSSGILNLTQAINVIIGANIGTTVTAWIIAFAPNVKYIALAAAGIGAILYFFFQKERTHNTGLAIMGLGFIFMGLFWMNEGVDPIKTDPDVKEVFASLNVNSISGLAKCFFLPLIFTALIQSSSAMTAIVMTLSLQGLISFEAAAASVFGMNIGTTITAWLAAIGGTTESRRTAMAHTIFNVTGTILLMPFFIPVILPITKAIFPNWQQDPATPMAAIHTGFNLATTLIFVPFTKSFAKLVTKIVPAKASPKDEQTRLTYLNPHVKLSPQIACEQAFKELLFISSSNVELLEGIRAILSNTAKGNTENHILHREEIIDRIQCEITEFLGRVMTSRLPVIVADQARAILRITDELESVSDEMRTIVKAIQRFRDGGGDIENAPRAILLDIHDRLATFAEATNQSLESSETEKENRPVANADEISEDIRERVRNARQEALVMVGTSPKQTLAILDILNAYERARSYYLNVSQTLAGGKNH